VINQNQNQNPQENMKSVVAAIRELKEDTANFFQTRYQMLLAELKQKISAVKLALPLFAVAAVFALLSLFVLTGALVFVIGQAIGFGWALLIVGVVYLIIAGACAWIGINELRSAGVAPKRTLEVLKQDQVWLQSEARSV